jgi:hypothetical protein
MKYTNLIRIIVIIGQNLEGWGAIKLEGYEATMLLSIPNS